MFTSWYECCDATCWFLTWWITDRISWMELNGSERAWEVWLNWLNWSLVRINIKGMENISNEKTPESRWICPVKHVGIKRVLFWWNVSDGGCVVLPEEPPAAEHSAPFASEFHQVFPIHSSIWMKNTETAWNVWNPTASSPQGDVIITCCEDQSAHVSPHVYPHLRHKDQSR